jgi:hypothetical protein
MRPARTIGGCALASRRRPQPQQPGQRSSDEQVRPEAEPGQQREGMASRAGGGQQPGGQFNP